MTGQSQRIRSGEGSNNVVYVHRQNRKYDAQSTNRARTGAENRQKRMRLGTGRDR